MGVKIEINIPATVNRLSPQFQEAQKFIDSEVLRDCNPYVPMRTGVLAGSGTRGTRIGSGKVVYNVPYARRMYYGVGFNFSKEKNPKACAQWFEKAKAVKGKEWEKGVNRKLRGQ